MLSTQSVQNPISTFFQLLSVLLPDVYQSHIKEVAEGFADAGPGQSWIVEKKRGGIVCIAPNPEGSGWIVVDDGARRKATSIEELVLLLKELQQ